MKWKKAHNSTIHSTERKRPQTANRNAIANEKDLAMVANPSKSVLPLQKYEM